jgi:hypothetical protein
MAQARRSGRWWAHRTCSTASERLQQPDGIQNLERPGLDRRGTRLAVRPHVALDELRAHSVSGELGSDPAAGCSDLPEVGTSETSVRGSAGMPDPETDEQRFRFEVPAGTQVARLALNGEDTGLNGDVPFAHGYRMYARQDSEPSVTDSPCGGDLADPYKFCESEQPGPGPLHVLLERVAGDGQYQLTLTLFAGPPITPQGSPTPTATVRQTPTPRPTRPLGPCIGDCDRDGRIAINELVRGVGIALTGASPSTCVRLDDNGNGTVSVNELVSAVGAALNGCIAP